MTVERILLCAKQSDPVSCCTRNHPGKSTLEKVRGSKSIILNLALDVATPVFGTRTQFPPQERVGDARSLQCCAQALSVELRIVATVRVRADVRFDPPAGFANYQSS